MELNSRDPLNSSLWLLLVIVGASLALVGWYRVIF